MVVSSSISLQDGCAGIFSDAFALPTNRSIGASRCGADRVDKPCTYLCGNSLGPLPRRSEALVQEEFRVWQTRAVEGHFSHPHGREWTNLTDHVTPLLAEIVGAKEKEVACMGTLTANLHLMMTTFYKPTAERYKILCEAKAFPSDQYALTSQALLHGLNPETAIVEVTPREGEYILREEDILDTIAKEGPSIALVLFSGVQYYTGQYFPIESITRKAQEQGCMCGWDLAHAVGNVPLYLHNWDVDFAVWCTYKYLNSGPGGIGALFIHEKWDDSEKPKQAGWWGNLPSTRFAMLPTFSPTRGAQGYQQSNPSVLATVSLLGSLQVFKEAGMMQPLRKRSIQLTAMLETLFMQSRFFVPLKEITARYPEKEPNGASITDRKSGFTIITPSDPDARGAMLSLLILPLTETGIMGKVFDTLMSFGVVGDKREPSVIRLSPAPLFNSFDDCKRAANALETGFEFLSEKLVVIDQNYNV